MSAYLALTTPRIVGLVLFTAFVGLRVGSRGNPFSWGLGLMTLLGLGLAAAGAAALNHYMDRELDARMPRTARRPIPSGRIPPARALLFGLILSGTGILLLFIGVSPLAGLLTLLNVLLYTPLYTLYKRVSPYSAVLGSAIGALPPAIGWVAARGSWGLEAGLLFALLFLWQPAHFWALTLIPCVREDYRTSRIPILPLTHGETFTRLQTLLYACSLLPLTLLMYLAGIGGQAFLVTALAGGTLYAGLALGLWLRRVQGGVLFRYSMLYLLLVLAPLILETTP